MLRRILKYELRRLIWNKIFIGLLFINGVYSWYILSTDTIKGTAYTAPFSQWSFGTYLASVMPLAVLTMLFLVSIYYSKQEKQVEVLTTATPINPIHYALVRSGVIAIGFLIICMVLFGLSLFFYISVFNYWDFTPFILPTLMILLPCFFFSLGVGYIAGRIHPRLLYVLMLVALIIGFAGNGGDFDFFGHGYFSSYPLTLPIGSNGEPAFVVSAGFGIARVLYLVVGVILLTISLSVYRRKVQIS